MRMRTAIGVLAAVTLLGLAACGDDGADEASPGPGVGATTVAPAPTAPPGTVWAAGPDPCSLLTSDELSAVMGFDVNAGVRDSKTVDGTPTVACIAENRRVGLEGGQASITVLPPGTDLLADRSNFVETRDLEGIGASAYAGRIEAGYGAGENSVVVDMGDGGFTLGVFVFQDLPPVTVEALARTAADRWAVDGS